MELLKSLFGSKDRQRPRFYVTPKVPEPKLAKRLVFLPQGDRFEVVGESRYQDELQRLAGGRTKSGHSKPVVAMLFPEEDNPVDQNAVQVVVNELVVGYIPRESCDEFRGFIAAARDRRSFLAAHAVIVGGWDRGDSDTGFFGIYLDVNLADRYVYAAPGLAEHNDTLNVRSTRLLAPLPTGRLLDIAGESSKARSLCEVIGDRQDGFSSESFVATIDKAKDGSLLVVAVGSKRDVAIGGARQIGTIPRKITTHGCASSRHTNAPELAQQSVPWPMGTSPHLNPMARDRRWWYNSTPRSSHSLRARGCKNRSHRPGPHRVA